MSESWCVLQTPSSLPPFTSDPLVTLPLQGDFASPRRRGMGHQEPTPNSSAHSPDTSSTFAAGSSMSHADVSGSHVPGSAPPSLSPLRLVRRRGKSLPDLVCSAEELQPRLLKCWLYLRLHMLCMCVACCAVLCCAVLCCAVLC